MAGINSFNPNLSAQMLGAKKADISENAISAKQEVAETTGDNNDSGMLKKPIHNGGKKTITVTVYGKNGECLFTTIIKPGQTFDPEKDARVIRYGYGGVDIH